MNTVTHKQQTEGIKDNAGNINSDTNNSNPNNNKNDRKFRIVCPTSETSGKMNNSTDRCYGGANAVNRPLPWKSKPQQQDAQDKGIGSVQATAQHLNEKFHLLTPEQWLTDRRPTEEHSTIPMCCPAATFGEICEKFKLATFQNDSTAETKKSTHTPQLKQRDDLESQTSPLKEDSLENPEPQWNSSEKMKLLANQYCASKTPRTFKTKPKEQLTASQLNCNGDDDFSFFTKTTSTLFGKRLWEMKHGRVPYIGVLHCSSWKVYLHLDFVNYLITHIFD